MCIALSHGSWSHVFMGYLHVLALCQARVCWPLLRAVIPNKGPD
jgi:hypothetical protein